MGLQGFGREMVDEEDAVEMIDFMLGCASEESLCLKIKCLTREILADDAYAGWTIHIFLKSRNAQAAFDIEIAFFSDGMNLRIDHHKRHE